MRLSSEKNMWKHINSSLSKKKKLKETRMKGVFSKGNEKAYMYEAKRLANEKKDNLWGKMLQKGS